MMLNGSCSNLVAAIWWHCTAHTIPQQQTSGDSEANGYWSKRVKSSSKQHFGSAVSAVTHPPSLKSGCFLTSRRACASCSRSGEKDEGKSLGAVVLMSQNKQTLAGPTWADHQACEVIYLMSFDVISVYNII